MFSAYRAVFRAPGSAKFCAAAFVMRMPIAIYPIGIVLIISARDGRYGFAGLLSACYVFGGGVGMIASSVLVDRLGQRRVLLPAAAMHAAAVVALALLARGGAPDWLLVLPTVAAGFCYLSVGSLVRARWSFVLDGRPELGTALSLESVLDELIFVIGPLIATVLATQTVPVSVLYVAGVLVVAGSLWLRVQPDTEPPVSDRDGGRHPFALRARGMVMLTVTTMAMGAVFASAEVSAVAFCGQHGQRGASGVALAAIAAGSAVSGLLYGARERAGDTLGRLRRQMLLFAVLPVVLLAAVNVPVLVVAEFVLGIGIAPTLINAFGLATKLVAPGALTEGLAWITTGLSVGYGAGAALVGGIADQHGARAAFIVVLGASVTAGLLVLALHARLRTPPGGAHDARDADAGRAVGRVRENH
jgi:MFS family permease